MSLRSRFYFALASSVIVIGLHMIAHTFYLYWIYKQIDIPMHMLGGLMSGLYVLVALRYFKLQESVRNVLLGVLFVGVAWEVLEIWYKVAEIHMGYWLNTGKDIVSDLVGGYLSLKLWKRLPEMK
ncbi:MAG: hypothetical protein FGM57_00880 [Candidatus Taylorbacteria bacterium]|nr:hypothetical protein [Candidatus Taylorbacteria bacterium]